MGEQAFLLDGVEDRKCRGARDRVAPERGTVVTLVEDVGVPAEADARPDGQPTTQTFGECDDVRAHVLALMGEPATGAADTALDLVEDECCAGVVTDFPDPGEVALGCGNDPGLSLGRFGEHCDAVFVDGLT